MDRSELFLLDKYKTTELKERLTLITDWSKVKIGDLIYHEDSVKISYYDEFKGFTEEGYIKYSNFECDFTRSKNSWYFYDEYIVDEVEEKWTPKLWNVSCVKYPEDYLYFIACNEEHLLKCWNKEQRDSLSMEQFKDTYNINEITKCDDFYINVV